ncbi:CNNM domain-containing protein [Bariatricus sp. SGI.154]|uniref:CNNM domain-containing protein n=1 Tax=Bariatricus sp. SGI.154 TaxID=3420549 RepID=UPI003D03884C
MIGTIILQVVLIFLNATFASAEIAVISMNETKLRMLASDGDKRAVKLSALTEQPARFVENHVIVEAEVRVDNKE